jgi:SAM-dependent methyltransferase
MSDVFGNSPFDRGEIAALYDAVPFAADIPFYLDLAAGAGRVLELGCGTGRLLLPLADAGSQVVGVDASRAMLARARRRLAHAPRELRERVQLRAGDMRGLELEGRFDAVVVATKTFFYLMTPGDQRRMLSTVARLLEPGGVVALDLLNPTVEWLSRPAGSVQQDIAGQVGEARVLRTETVVSTDPAEQRRVMRSVYDVVEKDGTVRKHVVEWGLRYTYRFELEHLLELCGLEVLAVTGGYRGEPFEADSPIMLVTARR